MTGNRIVADTTTRQPNANRLTIQGTRTPDFIANLGNIRGLAGHARGAREDEANRAANGGVNQAGGANQGVVREGNVVHGGANQGAQREVGGVQGVHGVQGGQGMQTVEGRGIRQIHEEGAEHILPNELRALNERVTGGTREDYAADLAANQDLVDALAGADLHPTADGLVRVDQAIKKNPTNWGDVLEAAKAVTATGGKSAAANKALGNAMAAFMQAAGLRKTDTADLSYLLARIMMKTDDLERDDSMKRLTAALAAAQARLKQLEDQRQQVDRQQTTPVQQGGGGGGKKDDGGNQSSNVAQVADEEARKTTQKAQLDLQITNTKALIQDLERQIAEGKGAGGQHGQTNQELVTEAILAMVEQAHAMGQLTQNQGGEQRVQGGQGANQQGGQGGQRRQ